MVANTIVTFLLVFTIASAALLADSSCQKLSCKMGQYCVKGKCLPDPCFRKICLPGQKC
jgi:hypothetical protein